MQEPGKDTTWCPFSRVEKLSGEGQECRLLMYLPTMNNGKLVNKAFL
jgi:hypothetical protein